MRLLLLAPASSAHTRRWVDALVARGIEVDLVTQHDAAGWSPPDGATLHRLPRQGMVGYFSNARALRRIVARTRPDLINAHYASGYGTTAALVGHRPTVLSVWGSDVYEFPYRSWPAGRLVRWNLRRAQRITSTSRAMADQVRTLVPGLAAVDVVPFGVDSVTFHPSDDPRDTSCCTIGTVKGMSRIYGIDVLVDAYSRLLGDADIRSAGLQLRLVLVGGGPELSDLEASVRRAGVEATVRFVGQVPHDEVPGWLHRFDIFVAPSRRESFGVAVLEASSSGLPVIVSDVGGLPEVVAAEETGIIVPVEDVAALAHAMKRLVLDDALRRRMGAAGRTFVQRTYEWERCVDLMVGSYEAVLRDTPAATRRDRERRT